MRTDNGFVSTLKSFLRRFTWDTYLSARQAVELGLADRVLEPCAAGGTKALPEPTFVTPPPRHAC